MRPAVPVAFAAFAALLAGCAEGPPPPGPVGVPAEGLPPQAVSPEGVLGGAEVGASAIADPEIETMGDPLL